MAHKPVAVFEVMALVPPGVVTVTSTVLAVLAGEMAVIDVGELTVKLAAGVVPKATFVTPVKPEPLIVTVLPPDAGPFGGKTRSTVGGGM